jgi:alpha-tubulin suppressor-like RCC1 family protein
LPLYATIQIASGAVHSLILNSNGNVFSFGRNIVILSLMLKDGQLGLGDYDDINIPTLISSLDNIIQISTGSSHSMVLNRNGRVYAFGLNNVIFTINLKVGQLGLGDNFNRSIPTLINSLTNITQISLGGSHSMVLNNQGRIYSFGGNGVI